MVPVKSLSIHFIFKFTLLIQVWFQLHSPFIIGEELIALDTGLVEVGHSLTCDNWWQHSVGGDIQKEMDGQAYTDCPIKQSKQISTFQSLYASFNVGTEKVTIDPLTLFIHLILLVERKP